MVTVLARSPAHVVIFLSEICEAICVVWDRSCRYDENNLFTTPPKPYSDIVYLVRWSTIPKALFKSMKTPHVNCRLSIFL